MAINNGQIKLLVLNCKNIFREIKFLICIHETPSTIFATFQTQFAKVSFLGIFSHKNIFSYGITHLTNGKGSFARKHTKCYLIFPFLAHYFYTICCKNVSEQRLSSYMIKSTLNWSHLISTEKKHANSGDQWRRLQFLICL